MGKLEKERFLKWLESGTEPLVHCKKDEAYTLIKHPKNDSFDYLYCGHAYHTDGIKMGEDFKFYGVYNKLDHKLYNEDYSLSYIVDDWQNNNRTSPNTMANYFENAVRRKVESIINNDRNNLSIKQITNTKLLDSLEHFKTYIAAPGARESYLANDNIDSLVIKCNFSAG